MTDLTLVERIAAVEQIIKNLPLDSLPLGQLQRKLENDWQPDAAVLMQPSSITVDQLASGLKLAVGRDTLVFTAATDSGVLTVKHSLGLVPLVAGGIAADNAAFADIPAFSVANKTNTSFDIKGRKPTASTVNVPFYWIAVA